MLEVKIEELTKAVIALTELIGKIEAKDQMADITRKSLEIIGKDLEERTTEKVKVKECVEIVKQEAPAVLMPAAPTFEPVVEAAGKAAPFTDGKGLIDYVMTAYKEMGAEKGAKIQGVLTEMGLQNVNELRPTEYDAFYTKVEALK